MIGTGFELLIGAAVHIHAAWQLMLTSNEFVIIMMLSRPVIVLLGGDEAFDGSV